MRLSLPLLVLGLFARTAVGAVDAQGPRDLPDFLVYTKAEIVAARSDYQGPTGAGGAISLTDFLINGSLLSGEQVSFLRGTVKGTLFSALRSRLDRATARAVVRGAGVAERARFLSARIDLLSARLAALAPNALPARSENAGEARLDLTASGGLTVVDVREEDLVGVTNIVAHGDGASRLIVRVHGANLRLVGGFFAEGIRPSQILWFFPEANVLTLGGGGARDASTGLLWGIPGSVVAPCALVNFSSALLTGQLYAAALHSTAGGQVNASAFEGLPALLRSCGAESAPCP